MEAVLGNLLRIGVIVSAAVVAAGAAIYLARHAADPPQYHAFRGEPSDLRSARGVVGGLMTLHGRGIIQFGLLLLIATPLVRVATSLVGFLRRRDWTYVLVTLVVSALLAYSILGT